MAATKNKLWLVGSPDRDWYSEPVEAADEIAAIKETEKTGDESITLSLGYAYRVYELASADHKDFKTSIEVVPA
jgi:hypothetical protein